MRKSSGLSLIEVLIALFVLGIVAAIATTGVINGLRVQSVNEASTAVQAKLRRITEVFTQELRSAVLGGVTNQPYDSGSASISFLLLDGGAGYQVIDHTGNFQDSNSKRIVAPAATAEELDLFPGQALLVNGNGEAVVFTVTGISNPAETLFDVQHGSCGAMVPFTDNNTILLSVRSLGLRFDKGTGTLYQTDGAAAEVPLAFAIDAFNLEYVYRPLSGGDPVVLDEPIKVDGVPMRNGTYSGENVTMARVQLTIGASELSGRGNSLERSYRGQVEMASNPTFQIQKVVNCG